MKALTSFWIFMLIWIHSFSQELPQDYQWESRVLLVFAPTSEHEVFQEQVAAWEAEQAGLEERDLLVFKVLTTSGTNPFGVRLDEEVVESLRDKYQITEDQFWLILIGKDGSTKLSRSESISNQELFAIIDGMPMRKQEMADQDHRDD